MRKIAPGQVGGLQEITQGGTGSHGSPLPLPAAPRPAMTANFSPAMLAAYAAGAAAPPMQPIPQPAAMPPQAPPGGGGWPAPGQQGWPAPGPQQQPPPQAYAAPPGAYPPGYPQQGGWPAPGAAPAGPAAARASGGMTQSFNRGIIKQQVVGAYGQAKEILNVAEQEAARIIQDAERLREEQARLGYEEGKKQGYEEALGKLAEFEAEQQKIFDDLEPKIVKLSVAVAEKIIGSELSARPGAIAAIVGQALKTVRHQRDVNIRVHPSQTAPLEAEKKTLLGVLSRARDVTIRGDPNVREGGCIIETELGILDADLKTQLEILERALGGGLKKAEPRPMPAEAKGHGEGEGEGDESGTGTEDGEAAEGEEAAA